MTGSDSKYPSVSREFAERLKGYKSDAMVRVAVVCDAPARSRATGRPNLRGRRQEIIRETRAAANTAIEKIDKVLDKYGGRRLTESADALGNIPVETTAAGIRALARIKNVKAILEDQPLILAT